MGLKKLGKKIGKAAKKAGKAVEKNAKELGQEVKKAGQGVEKNAKELGQEVKKVAQGAKKIGSDLSDDVQHYVWDNLDEAVDDGLHVGTQLFEEVEKFICDVVGKEPGEDCSVSVGVNASSDGKVVLTDGNGTPSEVPPEEFNFMEDVDVWSWSKEQELQKFREADEWIFEAPLDQLTVTSKFGMRTLNGATKMHAATDFRAREPLPLYSAGPGYVVHAGYVEGYPRAGKTITVRLPNWIEVQYMHLKETHVSPGQIVTSKQVLGLTGDTGSAEGKPHLHMVVKVLGKRVDPELIIGKGFDGGTMGKIGDAQ